MIGIENKDSSFFTIESPDIDLENNDFSKDLISLSITERNGAMPQGSLSFYDPTHKYSRILRTGANILISWGYRDIDSSPDSLLAKKLNTDEFTGSIVRTGLQGFISSPNGSADSKGIIIYNCNFTSFGFRGTDQVKWHREGTKIDVISRAFDDLGISSSKRKIDFATGDEVINSNNAVLQEETTFRFLNRLALEWKALFVVGYSSDGEPIGMFIDASKVDENQLPSWAVNATGKSNIIGFKGSKQGEISNIISYKWTSNEGENGIGDNVKIDIVDGKMIFRRFLAEEEKVVSYRLNEERIQEAFKNEAPNGPVAQTKLFKELLSTKTFDQVKHFFDPIESATAPQGFGYRINAKMVGNPTYMPPNQIIINNGFPDRLGGAQSKYYINSVTHSISKSGYFMDLEIIDVFTLSPIGLPVR